MQPTREQILSEPAGPRLDVWVAEARGWTTHGPEQQYHDATGRPTRYFLAPNRANVCAGDAEHYRPSTDIAAAWGLVEELDRPHTRIIREAGKCGVAFCGLDGGNQILGIGDTTADAICRAYLLAKLSA